MGLALIKGVSNCLTYDIKLIEASRAKRRDKRLQEAEKLDFVLTHIHQEIANDSPRTQARILSTALKSFEGFQQTVFADQLLSEASQKNLSLEDLTYDDLRKFDSYQQLEKSKQWRKKYVGGEASITGATQNSRSSVSRLKNGVASSSTSNQNKRSSGVNSMVELPIYNRYVRTSRVLAGDQERPDSGERSYFGLRKEHHDKNFKGKRERRKVFSKKASKVRIKVSSNDWSDSSEDDDPQGNRHHGTRNGQSHVQGPNRRMSLVQQLEARKQVRIEEAAAAARHSGPGQSATNLTFSSFPGARYVTVNRSLHTLKRRSSLIQNLAFKYSDEEKVNSEGGKESVLAEDEKGGADSVIMNQEEETYYEYGHKDNDLEMQEHYDEYKNYSDPDTKYY